MARLKASQLLVPNELHETSSSVRLGDNRIIVAKAPTVSPPVKRGTRGNRIKVTRALSVSYLVKQGEREGGEGHDTRGMTQGEGTQLFR